MKRRDEGDVGILAQRVAKGQSPVSGQLGHQPVGDRLDTVVFLGLIGGRLHACGWAPLVIIGLGPAPSLIGPVGFGGDSTFLPVTAIAAPASGSSSCEERWVDHRYSSGCGLALKKNTHT